MIKYFIPFERIGNFILGSNIDDYLNDYSFDYKPKDTITSWETYSLNDDSNISLFVEDGLIVSILCEDECFYNGNNIIGTKIDYFLNVNNLKYDSFEEIDIDDFENQEVYDFDTIGLQAWCKNKTIVTIIINNGK